MLVEMLVKFNIKIEFELCCALYFLFIYSFVRFKCAHLCELISFSSATSFCLRLCAYINFSGHIFWSIVYFIINIYGETILFRITELCVCVSGIYSIDICTSSDVLAMYMLSNNNCFRIGYANYKQQ